MTVQQRLVDAGVIEPTTTVVVLHEHDGAPVVDVHAMDGTRRRFALVGTDVYLLPTAFGDGAAMLAALPDADQRRRFLLAGGV